MDQFTITLHHEFNVIALRGELSIHSLPALSPLLGDHIAKYARHLVLDFAAVTSIDSSIIHLLVNIQKRLQSTPNALYILAAPASIAETLRTAHCTNAIDSIGELECRINANAIAALSPYTVPEKGMQRLRCSCPVCNSKNVIGYLLDQTAYVWSWNDGDYFPRCSTRSGEEFDCWAAQPIVCLDCFCASLDASFFLILDNDGNVFRPSAISESAKNHLLKNTHKRKTIFNEFADAPVETIFDHPRSPTAAFCAYMLIDATIRIIAVNKAEATPFIAGVVNYRALKYGPGSQKELLIDNARTWISQAMNEHRLATHSEQAQAYYILFVAALSRLKIKDAGAILAEMTTMMDTLSFSKGSDALCGSPFFWSGRTKELWQQEIHNKSMHLAGAAPILPDLPT